MATYISERAEKAARHPTLIIGRFVYSFNHESDGHGCGRRQGDNPPCRVDQSDWIARHPVGSLVTSFYGAPGSGRCVQRVTRVDARGAWGVTVEDSYRELTIEEVR